MDTRSFLTAWEGAAIFFNAWVGRAIGTFFFAPWVVEVAIETQLFFTAWQGLPLLM